MNIVRDKNANLQYDVHDAGLSRVVLQWMITATNAATTGRYLQADAMSLDCKINGCNETKDRLSALHLLGLTTCVAASIAIVQFDGRIRLQPP